MPNGVDKNLRRLIMACAAYRARFDEWPVEARMAPIMIQDLAHLLDEENFTLLATRIRLRTKDSGLSVGGGRGVHVYGELELDQKANDLVPVAERWLGVTVRRDLEH